MSENDIDLFIADQNRIADKCESCYWHSPNPPAICSDLCKNNSCWIPINKQIQDDLCELCGKPGADKIPHPITWPGENSSSGLVHAECEQEECERAFRALTQQERDSFLDQIIRKA